MKIRVLDICFVLLVISFVALISAGVFYSVASEIMKLPEGTVVFSIMNKVGEVSTIVFLSAFLPLWLFTWAWYFQSLPTRGLAKNILWAVLIVGFSWITALYIYWKERPKLINP